MFATTEDSERNVRVTIHLHTVAICGYRSRIEPSADLLDYLATNIGCGC